MRRLRSDVSHRVRHRGPSIFSAGWFRSVLLGGLAVALALVIGPSVAGWLRADLPRSVFLLSPWGGSEGAKFGPSDAKPTEATAGEGPDADAAPESTATQPVETVRADQPDAVPGAPTASTVARSAPAAGSDPAPDPVSPKGPAVALREPAAALKEPAPVYWIQVGAFLDHQNADRLVERLRADGLSAATSVFEQSRTLYRVLLDSPDGSGGAVPDPVLDRVRSLGYTVSVTDDGPSVTAPVALRAAVETSHRLRDQGIQVRLRQEVGSATYRIVRVGSYATSKEAEAMVATLTARGFEGAFVVRDR